MKGDFRKLFEQKRPVRPERRRRAAYADVGDVDDDDEDADIDAPRAPTRAPEGAAGPAEEVRFEPWDLESDRLTVWKKMNTNRTLLWQWLVRGEGQKYARAFGLVLRDEEAPRTVYRNRFGAPTVEVHSVRTALRRSARGTLLTDLVVEIAQRRRGYFDPERQAREDGPGAPIPRDEDGDFKYRAGCTLLVDPATMTVRRVIRTAGTIADRDELDRVRDFLTGEATAGGNAFEGGLPAGLRGACARREPFALLHRRPED
jgi:hypothetical protein